MVHGRCRGGELARAHQPATHGPGAERRPGPERLGRAFDELIDRIPANRLPKVGGTDATIVITIDLDTLTGKLQKARRGVQARRP
ncbi:hypothetical protein GCM10023350_19100 [Nocardioides endophyticus]|uniref:Uncharacterized protein n=1 Tax=Nocardioides endophyticus TaxID=1353775 RepID=A0ABP8YRG2_9ACTN